MPKIIKRSERETELEKTCEGLRRDVVRLSSSLGSALAKVDKLAQALTALLARLNRIRWPAPGQPDHEVDWLVKEVEKVITPVGWLSKPIPDLDESIPF